ncbi:MAG: DNA-processing protein DprA [Bacteroidales bacterium]
MLIYQIALSLIPGIGDINAKRLVAYCGGVQAVFTERKKALLKIPGIGEATVNSLVSHNVFPRAEKEMEFIEKYAINHFFFLDEGYPIRLKQCVDSPIMLYFKGNAALNQQRIVSVVGTRRATDYGKHICRDLIEGMASLGVLVVSGLAYGIDTVAHKSAMDTGLSTIAVLGHGLDRIYPPLNRSLAGRIVNQGGLLTEFLSESNPDRENFPKRNRIVAGIADATIVIEAGNKGGALITADIANSYNRDVFAVPGRIGDEFSEGCNNLIRTNRAALIHSAKDISYIMNWDISPASSASPQRELLLEMTPGEEKIIAILKQHGECAMDMLSAESQLVPSQLASALLNLEFEGIVKCLPGKVFRLI